MNRLPCAYCSAPLELSHDGERLHFHEVASGARHVCTRKPKWRLPPLRPEPVTSAVAVEKASREMALAALEIRTTVEMLREMAVARHQQRHAPPPAPRYERAEPQQQPTTEGARSGALAI